MKKKIMVVDDEEDIRKLIRWFFQSKDYDIIEAADGRQCLEKIEDEKPDVILLDIQMPEMDGWEVSKRIKNKASSQDIPIAMVSVRASDDDIAKSINYGGADEHITKPIDFYRLNRTVQYLTTDN